MAKKGVESGKFSGQSNILSVTFHGECNYVGSEAFKDCTNLSKINDGTAIEEIHTDAFAGCTNLQSVTFNKLSSLESKAFKGCTNLSYVNMPKCENIPNEAFMNCEKLSDFNFNNVVTIGDSSFENCKSLNILDLKKCETIGAEAFMGCNKISQITLYKCREIKSKAFDNCSGLIDVYIKNPLDIPCVLIGNDIFEINNNLQFHFTTDTFDVYRTDERWEPYWEYMKKPFISPNEIIYQTIDGGIIGSSINNGANSELEIYGDSEIEDIDIIYNNYAKSFGVMQFNKKIWRWDANILKNTDAKDRLTSIDLPSECVTIANRAFGDYTYLKKITLPNTLKHIEYGAFKECKELASFEIPTSIETLGECIFAGCDNIEKFEGKFVTYDNKAVVYNNTLISFAPKCEIGKLEIQKTGNITHLGEGCFKNCKNLRRVDIPSTVTSIGNNAFEGCDNIYEIHFMGTTPPELGNDVFANISNENNENDFKIFVPEASFDEYFTKWETKGIMSHVYPMPESQSIIFITNDNTADISLTDESIKTSKVDKENISYYKINNNITNIPENLFASNSVSFINKVILGEGILSIGELAFENCSNLEYIYISDNITALKNHCFKGCAITKIHIPEGNKQCDFGTNPFYNCSNLKEFVSYQKNVSNDKRCYISNKKLNFFAPAELTEYEIPNGVTSIGNGTFYGCSSLTSVTIPNGVTSIGNNAFRGCELLTSLVIPNGVTDIGSSAFYGCGSLTNITIPDSVTSIGGWAFSRCSLLTSVVIPNSVTSIGSSAFQGCTSLTSVTIPNSVTSIGDQAFYDCRSLTSVTIPNSVKSIMTNTFNNCISLTSVTIPDSVTNIGHYAFYSCRSLTSITIPNSVSYIGDAAFAYCASLTSVYCNPAIPPQITQTTFNGSQKAIFYVSGDSLNKYQTTGNWTKYSTRIYAINQLIFYTSSDGKTIAPNNTNAFGANIVSNTYSNGQGVIIFNRPVTSIGIYAFSSCASLTSVTIPNSVTSIGMSAFNGCKSLTSVTIPNSVTSIGLQAFDSCNNLTSVTIPNSVTSIGGYVFSYCRSLTSITIPNSVTSFGDHAFYNCTSLTSVTIPNSVTSIGSSAFEYCTSLTSITIPNGITSIGNSAFKSCTGLTSVTIGNRVTSIGGSAFYGCTSLSTITIPNSVTSIGEAAFNNCINIKSFNGKFASSDNRCLIVDGVLNTFAPSGLTKYIIPNGVTSIGNSAFYGCSSLTSVTIPDSVTSIGNVAFSGCSGMADVIIGKGVKTIDEEAFSECSSLTSITIPASVTEIRDGAFYGCTSLTSVTIGNSVTSIGNRAFSGCDSLTSVTIPDSVTWIGADAFRGCTSLTSVYCKSSTPPKIGDNVFTNNASNRKFYVDIRSINDYKSEWSSYKNYIFDFGTTILYTSSDKKTISPKAEAFDANIVSNTYSNGQGVIIFNGPITSIGNSAFYNMSRLLSITIPNGDKKITIGNSAFYNCDSLTSVTIPDSVTAIGSFAFHSCSSLASVTIGNSVTTIGSSAFHECYLLKSVAISESVTAIGDTAFYTCPYDAKINCNPATPPSIEEHTFNTNSIIYVKNVSTYKNKTYWKNCNIQQLTAQVDI